MQKAINEMVLLLFSWILISPAQVLSYAGLCDSDPGQAICTSCSSISASIESIATECCDDSDAYAICSFCFHNPGQCESVGEIIYNIVNDQDFFEPRQTRSSGSKRKDPIPYYIPPQRRAKYFLGKRDGGYTLYGRPDSWAVEADFDKRAKPFLGKKAKPFLGKRFDDESFYDKRAKPFLGKRDVSYLQTPELEADNALDKRAKPFLGKRSDSEAGENQMNYLPKDENAIDEEDIEKRSKPFLGKRDYDEEDKRSKPFLGKREEAEKRAKPFLGKRSEIDEKRAKPFLGKRAKYFLGKRGSYFLGKRADDNMEDSLDNTQGFYTNPFTRRAKYFLGKRADSLKRQKYFLGKRTSDEYDVTELSGEDDKRQSYFLGKRSAL